MHSLSLDLLASIALRTAFCLTLGGGRSVLLGMRDTVYTLGVPTHVLSQASLDILY